MNYSLFGTDGIRRTFGTEPLTPKGLSRLGRALGKWIYQKHGANSTVLFAHDTRESCQEILNKLVYHMNQCSIKVIYTGVVPTPAVARLVVKYGYAAGIMITASHNHHTDNGVKIFDELGNKICNNDEAIITKYYHDLMSVNSDTYSSQYRYPCAILQDDYINILLQIADLAPGSFSGIKIVIDTAHGALFEIAPKILNLLGAEVITLHNMPNGANINNDCGAVYPEKVQTAVLTHQAKLGFAFDGDGDRVIAVNSEGIIKNGDDILAIISTNPIYQNYQYIIGTSMTNCGLEQFAHRNGKKVIRTHVGDKNVARKINLQKESLGGEASGHILLPHQPITSDALLAMLLCIQTMIITKNESLASFPHYPQITLSIPIQTRIKLSESPISDLIKEYEHLLKNGRLLVRYSGTEPVLRIMGEAKDHKQLTTTVHELAIKLRSLL